MRRFATACVLVLGGCRSGGFHDGVFTKPGVRYALPALDDGWKPVSVDDGDLAWLSATPGQPLPHTIAVDSTCAASEDAPLDVLTNHLLMGFTERQRLNEALEQLDGREALHSRYDAKLDGVPVELEMVVMKKDGCVYDFVYTSPPGRGDEKRAAFRKLLIGFKTEPTS
jgi:hypothetical protein